LIGLWIGLRAVFGSGFVPLDDFRGSADPERRPRIAEGFSVASEEAIRAGSVDSAVGLR
jgi:hypothetical protein